MNHTYSCIAASLLACAAANATATDAEIPGKIYDAKQTEEFSKGRFAHVLQRGAPFWTPSEVDIRSLEQALPSFLATHWPSGRGSRIDISDHKRQYFGVTISGSRMVFVNAFCKSYWDSDGAWPSHFVFVFDGGSCFFQFFYDPATRSFRDLRVNGFAFRTLPNKAMQLTGHHAVSVLAWATGS